MRMRLKMKAKKHEEKKNKKGNKEIEELKAQVAELTDKCARAQAEVINFKKRKETEAVCGSLSQHHLSASMQPL